MSNILYRLARLAYHVTRSKADRRRRLKHTQEFVEAMAVIDRSKLSEDALADAILEQADDSRYDEDELVEATYYLACTGLDREVIDLLPHVVTLADRTCCALYIAADGLAQTTVLFDLDPSDADRVVADITHAVWKTKLTVSDLIGILMTVGPYAKQLDCTCNFVIGDIRHAYRELHEDCPEHELKRAIREDLRQKYESALWPEDEDDE